MALKKLGIDEDQVKEASPIFFDGYYYEDIPGAGEWDCKKEDGVFRSSNYNAVQFFFSADQVYCYQLRFSFVRDKLQETTDEYFYRDIVSVSTQSDSTNWVRDDKSGNVQVSFEKFKLTTSGGTSIEATVFNLGEKERAIQGMKNLLRSKKQG